MADQEKTELELLEEKIAERKRRVTDATSAREAAERLARAKIELARLEQQEIAAGKVAEYSAKHGPKGVDWDTVEFPDGRVVIVRKPSRVKYEEWQKTECSIAFEHLIPLVSPCVEYPSQAELDALLSSFPAKCSALAAVVNRLGGAVAKDYAGK